MSLRLEMLQVARLAPGVLGEAASLVEGFVRRCQMPDGGFRGREARSDLYYTSFAIDALTALRVEWLEEPLRDYLRGFGDGDGLDFIHLCCLSRLWSAMREDRLDEASCTRLLGAIEAYRTPDGGYEARRGSNTGSAYGCLIGYAAYADHARVPPQWERLRECLETLRVPGGGWSNDPSLRIASGPATAAAVSLGRNLRMPLGPEIPAWLMQCFHAGGGFRAIPDAPMPDLLSTAVILHALDGMQVPLQGIREASLDFVDSLWTNEGGFHGSWADDTVDVEYTYYGLLALGHLAL
ncbi:MAG: hypothetical protein KGS60_00635 [Verrucomicrobia bacterium]|nr:hypothetical protein [Verrucomicrobiota bacterium]